MERVRELLERISTMTLATTDLEGNPNAAPVYFVHDKNWKLYFFSDALSHHNQNLTKNQHAAAAIYPPCEGWQDIQGLQLLGEVFLVESAEVWDHA